MYEMVASVFRLPIVARSESYFGDQIFNSWSGKANEYDVLFRQMKLDVSLRHAARSYLPDLRQP